jgi:hypothetical protein
MKALLLLLVSIYSIDNAFAQRTSPESCTPQRAIVATQASWKTTRIGDTILLSNTTTSDTLVAYKYGRRDSGYVTGTNVYNDLGFAERYSFNGNDSAMRVLGIFAQFTGKYRIGTTNTANFKVWRATNNMPIRAHVAYNGFPGQCLDTLVVPFSNLGIGTTIDTLKKHMFPHASAPVSGSFFVGYDMPYNFTTLAGDTIALYSSKDGQRTSAKYEITVTVNDFGDTTRDTLVNVQNATQWADSVWHDNYTDNQKLFHNLAIYPIVAIIAPTGNETISSHELTVSGVYPNPCSQQAKVTFSLAQVAKVSVFIYNMAGTLVAEQSLNKLSIGTHQHQFDISQQTAGTYMCLIKTDAGAGICSVFQVVK